MFVKITEMSLSKSSYLSLMYNPESLSEKINQQANQILSEINQDLNDNFEAQEQQQQEYSRVSTPEKKTALAFFSCKDETDSHHHKIVTTNMNFKCRLERFYTHYCPEKNNQLGIMVNKYKWKEEALFKSLEKKYGPEPGMSDNDYYTVRERIDYQNNVQTAKKSIKPVFDGYHLDEDTLLLLARIEVDTQEGGSLSEKLLELI